MDVQLLSAVALVLLLGLSAAQKEISSCLKANARSCAECIQVSESCGWCSDESFLTMSWAKSERCDDLQSLLMRNCPPGKIENPRGSINIQENRPLTDRTMDSLELKITQIQPQKLMLTLRPGEPQTFSLKFKRTEDYPIDLYYLMDLSSSMKDDLENVKILGTDLMTEMKRITSNLRIGIGSIVKTATTPCTENQNCSSPFTYKNVLKLTDKGEEFHRLVSQQQISDEVDSPEGGLDAIMQVAVCEEQIGWRNAARFLVFSTDRGVRFPGDGTLMPHSAQCQLENHTYTDNGQISLTVSQLAQTLSKHNIQTVFAVPDNILPVYKELMDRLPKSAVGTLSSNSSNVLKLIVDAYNSLSLEVILENSRLPEGVSISYKSLCKNGAEGMGESGHKCSNISIGDEVSFEISIVAQKCTEHSKAEVIKIKPVGFNEEVEVALNFICECQCSSQGVPQSDMCNKVGTSECGVCNCDPGRIGSRCECNLEEMWMMEDPDARCRKDQNSDICSNNGDCVCGTCECKKRENPAEVYSGMYCECDNFNCDRSNNKLCGGHGKCECRTCICDANYTGSACDCSLDVTPCLAKNGQVCNGRGICQCGTCKCTDPKFQGLTCEVCPTCPGVCGTHDDCVQCRAFGKGQKMESCESDCSYFTMIKVKTTSDLPSPFDDDSAQMSHCRMRDENDCWYYFAYVIRRGSEEIYVVDKLAPPLCASPQERALSLLSILLALVAIQISCDCPSPF